MVSVDVKRHVYLLCFRVQVLFESRGGRPGLPVPNKSDDFCGLADNEKCFRVHDVGVILLLL